MSVCPSSAAEEVAALTKRDVRVQLVELGGQCYAMANAIAAPSPPWDRDSYDVLIAIPAAYNDASLDAFYLALPYRFKESTHPRASGAIIHLDDRQWQLVSWHYPDGRQWQRGLDTLESHIVHCRGFFFNRGSENAYD